MAMRAERAARRDVVGSVRMRIEQAERSGQVVLDVDDVTKRFGARPIVEHFSARIMRGDRVGLIGANGAGKTTLLRLLLGELAPDEGEVRRGANVEITYYDQQREQLDPDRTVFETVGDGNDTVTVNGRTRHVNAYLDDFLFAPERARPLGVFFLPPARPPPPARSFAGGEPTGLLLARLFTRAATLLALDEP